MGKSKLHKSFEEQEEHPVPQPQSPSPLYIFTKLLILNTIAPATIIPTIIISMITPFFYDIIIDPT